MIWFGFMTWKTTLVDPLHLYVYLLFRSVNRFRVGQNIYQSFTTRYISEHLAPLIYSNYFCF